MAGRRTCAWPGCEERPKRKLGGMCPEHAAQCDRDALATAYFALADQLDELWEATSKLGMPESTPPDPPGPRELRRLARDSRILAARRLGDLPDRRPRAELLTGKPEIYAADPIKAGVYGLAPADRLGQRLTQEQWQTLMAVLGMLSPSEHEALILVRGRGLSHREAAREMETTAGSVYNLLERAQAKLAEWRSGKPAQATWEI